MPLSYAERAAPAETGNGSRDNVRSGGSNIPGDNAAPTQLQARCRQCGAPLPARRRLKFHCSYACRGQQKALQAIDQQTGLSSSKNLRQIRALRSAKRLTVAGFAFVAVNDCTYRIDAVNKRGVAWLMATAADRWIARVRNRASPPSSLEQAKQRAVAFLRERDDGELRDWIAELHEIMVVEIERADFPRIGDPVPDLRRSRR